MSSPKPPVAPKNPDDKAPGRGFWALRDIPTLLWLVLVAVAVVTHRWLPEPRWLMIHLLLLGGVTHAIMVWSQYFSYALLRSSPTVRGRQLQSWRLALTNGGAVLVVAGVLSTVWPLTLVGAAALIAGVIWHGASLYARSRKSLPGRFGKTIRYYIAAAAILPIGAALGAWLAHDNSAANLVLAHALLNVLGWIGLTIAGTLVTLWPTILRTRADEHAATGAARALPVLAASVLVAAAGAAAALLPVLVTGLIGYVVGLSIIGVSLWRAARQAPPRSFSALSIGMGVLWWIGSVIWLIVATIVSFLGGTGFDGVPDAVDQIVPFLAAGFAAQVLLGALSYLIPVVLGGGPTPVRIGTTVFDRGGALRIAVANAALVVCALPVSSLMRVVASLLFFIAMASFLVLMLLGMRAQGRAKKSGEGLAATKAGMASGDRPHGPIRPEGDKPHRAGQAVAGLLAVVLAVAVTAAVDPVSLGWSASAGAADANAPVKVVQVQATSYKYTPNTIEVPAGTRLKIELTNVDTSMVHDLVFSNGVAGHRLSPGESETIDVGVITADLDGWCSIIGHKQLGMTMTVKVTGAAASTASPSPSATDDMGDMDMGDMDMGSTSGIDLSADPGPGFEPYNAKLPALAASSKPVTRRVTMTVTDKKIEVAPGVTQTLWVYNGTAPGPVLHGRVGDTFVVTLINDGDMGHSIDFHAGSLAPDEPMRTIAPGESLTYTFTATRSGIWMYHCSTMPMTAHIANGMYGAVVIEPKELPAVDESYVLVQGEYYLGSHDGGSVDTDKIAEDRPDLVVFNGYANQYDHAPLTAAVGDRVRVWVLDAGPDRSTSFHIVGGQFDTVWSEGRYLIKDATDTGSQALGLMPAQGGFAELSFPEAGHYPFVSHFMIDAERGAHGIFEVTK
ncbi:multicopper oxidase domain-containing protein [Microbacterium horticulturae]|uniref:Copper-containing nitrite reductase n=1 Tax=Microbacterium horticulturae TaxID=3028316 RepID=A0ABY8BYD9_9MICO|nr:multicopper oxidase domain-containing protein [Microbacterium sp. KACC 23027]WEG07861.1 multicopper oxidase domain-containing protein [Microbacterium sp. KACC 23027]